MCWQGEIRIKIEIMVMEDTINILCATDNNYAPYCGIMLTSLFDSNKDCRFVVYVFEDGSVSEENVNKYQRLAKKYGNEIVLKTIDEDMVKWFPMNEQTHITIPTYYRLLAADLLPKEVKKVIYFDGDLVVSGDIKPLWNVNLDGMAIAAVRGPSPSYEDKCISLGYPTTFGYFNAGVLVCNLDYWREHDLMDKFVKFISKKSSDLPMMDQDVLNGVLYSERFLLPDRYNYMTMSFLDAVWERYTEERRRECIEEGDKRVIVHFAGGDKPWNYWHYGGPFFSMWDKYRRKSLWRDCIDTKPIKKHLKHMVKRCLFPNLMRNQHRQWVVIPENKVYYKDCLL